MVRLAAFSALVAVALLAPAQIVTHGVPASALSPTPDGREHGVPASALSPTPLPPGVNPPLLHPFFSHRPPRPLKRDHRHDVVVAVPIYYSVYGPGYDYGYPSVADPQVDPSADGQPAAQDSEAQVATSEEALRFAYLQGARDALAQAKEKEKESARVKPSPAKRDPFAPASTAKSDPEPKAEADSSPATVFIFKDGRKIETRNYAIMGKTLYDMSGSTLRKVQLNDLDTEATVKANDENGITVKLP